MLLDLSAVTDGLLGLIRTSWTSAPIWEELDAPGPTFTPGFTGLAPDAIRALGGAQLSLFLYHAETDNAQESSLWSAQMARSPGQPVRYLPLALDLYYLLSAFSETNYVQEQQAMSVALRILHANAVVRSDTTDNPAWQLTLTMEHRSYDELSRLWQATTAPLRLSVIYRAAVVFLGPEDPVAAARGVTTVQANVNGDSVSVTAP